MLCALIMAGGIGSRFWPKSTPDKPKQFLSLINDKTMLQMTYDRINKLVPKEKIFIVTNSKYINLVKEQLSDINDINIIPEPCSRNTAQCILLSSLYSKNISNEVNVVCISSDSYIKNEDKFLQDIELANEFVMNKKEAIVTIGITPTRPETGYGYIKFERSNNKVLKVSNFVEKPNFELAEKYFFSNEYLWNAGMFIFNTESILKEFKNNIPNEYNILSKLPDFNNKSYLKQLEQSYEKCTKISIDYAVMEKSNNVFTIPTNIGWDDIGTWQSLERYLPTDKCNNIIKGDVKSIDSYNNIIYGNNKKIVLLDVKNIFYIDSDDIIVIGSRDKLNEIHNLSDKI